MAAMMPSSDLANRLNRRVLPASFDVVDDPTREVFAGESLMGGYAVDDQGVQLELGRGRDAADPHPHGASVLRPGTAVTFPWQARLVRGETTRPDRRRAS